jgi:hypothetical protein
MGVLESARSGCEDWKARTRDVMNASGDEWKEKVSARPESVVGEPWGKTGSLGCDAIVWIERSFNRETYKNKTTTTFHDIVFWTLNTTYKLKNNLKG